MHLVARSARYWMKERGVMKMQVEYYVDLFTGSFGSALLTKK